MSTPLTRRFQRELKNNPKKAGILALLALVALYFWAPLVSGWFSKGTAATPNPAPQTSSVPATETGQPVTTEKPAVDWQQLAAWIQRDPRMQPETNLILPRDLFEMPVAAPEIHHEPVVETKQEKTEITPQLAGLSLSSTIVGPRKRVALLNGKAYRIGDKIASQQDDDTQFELMEIYARKIVLRSDGKSYELKLNPLKLANTAASSPSDTEELGDPSAN